MHNEATKCPGVVYRCKVCDSDNDKIMVGRDCGDVCLDFGLDLAVSFGLDLVAWLGLGLASRFGLDLAVRLPVGLAKGRRNDEGEDEGRVGVHLG